mmetsp:Transcript_67554/g.162187  ORF Transcript_67554/g.162187 Transcript_67554/m.162187 type:complete len:204 (+) Transcript_67554:792-1403(+)
MASTRENRLKQSSSWSVMLRLEETACGPKTSSNSFGSAEVHCLTTSPNSNRRWSRSAASCLFFSSSSSSMSSFLTLRFGAPTGAPRTNTSETWFALASMLSMSSRVVLSLTETSSSPTHTASSGAPRLCFFRFHLSSGVSSLMSARTSLLSSREVLFQLKPQDVLVLARLSSISTRGPDGSASSAAATAAARVCISARNASGS